MWAETQRLEQETSKESVKDFLAKELNKPEFAKKTTENIEKTHKDIQILKNILEKNIKPIVEKWGKLDVNNPIDIKKAKMLIAYERLEWWNIDGYFPKKPDEQINRATRILEAKFNENIFDNKQWETITLDNCTNPEQAMQKISYKAEFTSWNEKFDQSLQSNPLLKKYLDLQISEENLNRLSKMTGVHDRNPEKIKWKFDQLNNGISEKQHTMRKEEANISKELFSDPTKTMEFIKILGNITPEEMDTEWFYEIKIIIKDFLRSSNDKTFSWRDLKKNDGVDKNYETWEIRNIWRPKIETDNMQIISTWPDWIRLKNRITGQETILNKQVLERWKQIKEQSEKDEKYRENKEKEIMKKLGINPEDENTKENREIIWKSMSKEIFENDQILFDATRREMNNNRWTKMIYEEEGKLFNQILLDKWISNFDCTKGNTELNAKEINGEKVFILDQWDTKVILPFKWQAKLEEHKISQQEMNEQIKDTEKSSEYLRAEHEILYPKNSNKIDISWLWLNSKEITNLLSNPKLTEMNILNIDLSNNKITTFPGKLFSMKNISSINLEWNFIKELPQEIDKSKCENLESISLDNNNISEIPEQFLQLDQIKELSIANNRLSKIPSSIDKLSKLETLRISHNDIQELPENITKIKTLMILNAYECKLESLPKDINKLTNLGYLALDHNKLKEIPDISTLNNLKNLNLSDNNLWILPPLGSLDKLETLSIEDNKNLKEIPNDIRGLPKLKSEIRLSSNISSGEEVKDRFIDWNMSRQWYDFSDGANRFFNDKQEYKFTYAQWKSEWEALENSRKELQIDERTETFTMQKKLANGNYSVVVFTKAKETEYYKKETN